MTKFDELVELITRNKNKNRNKNKDFREKSSLTEQDDNLEVAGSEGSKNPIITFGDSETDPDLLEQLHRSPKHKPLDGFTADSWD